MQHTSDHPLPHGYALINPDGAPLIVTVSATRRGVAAKALQEICGQPVNPEDSDAALEGRLRGYLYNYHIEPVTVSRFTPPSAEQVAA